MKFQYSVCLQIFGLCRTAEEGKHDAAKEKTYRLRLSLKGTKRKRKEKQKQKQTNKQKQACVVDFKGLYLSLIHISEPTRR